MCSGTKISSGKDFLVIVVEKGVEHGHVYDYTEQGDEYLNVDPSDIKVKVNVLKNTWFERVNDDLYTSINITLKEVRKIYLRHYLDSSMKFDI